MGKYGIGAHVRDPDGDECEIIGKPSKGMREVRYSGGKREVRYSGGKLDGMVLEWPKSRLEAVGLPARATRTKAKIADLVA